jgi:hypothetical protein
MEIVPGVPPPPGNLSTIPDEDTAKGFDLLQENTRAIAYCI